MAHAGHLERVQAYLSGRGVGRHGASLHNAGLRGRSGRATGWLRGVVVPMSDQKNVTPDGRLAVLTAERHRKMAESAHAYVRGSTTRFYEWLDASALTLPQGPPIWICGDCHVGNLGPVASAQGELAVEIRDLDQTVIGNPVHDLVRLALSLAMAARGSDLPGVTTAHILEHMTTGYEAAFSPDDAPDDARDAAMPKLIRRLMREAAGRSWKHLADERIEGTAPVIPIGKRFWRLTDEERQAIDALFDTPDLRALVTSLRGRADDDPVRVLGAAYWRKGCSSLGRLRFAALVAVGSGRAERHCLMDIKEAIAAAAPRAPEADMPRDNAERVVTGARALSPALGGRMRAGAAARPRGVRARITAAGPQAGAGGAEPRARPRKWPPIWPAWSAVPMRARWTRRSAGTG